MPIFTATFAGVAVSAAQDVFELVTPATTRAKLREVRIGQYSDAGDAQAEMLGVQIIRGYTTSGSGGATVTPTNLHNWAVAVPATGCTVERNNTTVAADGTAQIMIADTFNVSGGWWYRPPEDERITLEISTRLVVRITAPLDEITTNGTLVYEEIGHPTVTG